MLDKGFEQKTSNGVWWIGIRLRDGVDAEAIRQGRWDGPVEVLASSSEAVGQTKKASSSEAVGRPEGA